MKKLKSRFELAQYFAELGFTKGAEIGVCYGYYSETLLNNIPGLELLCIDSWIIPRWPSAKEGAVRRLSPYPGATIIQKDSAEAAVDVLDESLDFVFIDAEHSYESVKRDIAVWAPKVRKGGIVSGHDYYVTRSGNTGVVDAVDEYVRENGYEIYLTEWNKSNNHHKDERQPSWYFLKK